MVGQLAKAGSQTHGDTAIGTRRDRESFGRRRHQRGPHQHGGSIDGGAGRGTAPSDDGSSSRGDGGDLASSGSGRRSYAARRNVGTAGDASRSAPCRSSGGWLLTGQVNEKARRSWEIAGPFRAPVSGAGSQRRCRGRCRGRSGGRRESGQRGPRDRCEQTGNVEARSHDRRCCGSSRRGRCRRCSGDDSARRGEAGDELGDDAQYRHDRRGPRYRCADGGLDRRDHRGQARRRRDLLDIGDHGGVDHAEQTSQAEEPVPVEERLPRHRRVDGGGVRRRDGCRQRADRDGCGGRRSGGSCRTHDCTSEVVRAVGGELPPPFSDRFRARRVPAVRAVPMRWCPSRTPRSRNGRPVRPVRGTGQSASASSRHVGRA